MDAYRTTALLNLKYIQTVMPCLHAAFSAHENPLNKQTVGLWNARQLLLEDSAAQIRELAANSCSQAVLAGKYVPDGLAQD